MKKKLRPLGQITADMEPLLYEMTRGHEMQVHEIVGQILAWAVIHDPDALEEYEDETRPTLQDYIEIYTKLPRRNSEKRP